MNNNGKNGNEEVNDDIDDMLSAFLKKFTKKAPEKDDEATVGKMGGFNLGGNYYDRSDLERLNLKDYAKVRVDAETYNKLDRLQAIANSIETKVISKPEQLSLFPKRQYIVDYQNVLNEAQYLAVTTVQGPVLVIAGAGSGKTRVIVYRASYLLENATPPESILILTFTRKAAQELVVRTKQLLKNHNAERLVSGTFHAFSTMLLRRYAALIGIPSNFTIIDPSDSADIVDLIRTELKLNVKNKAFPRKARIAEIISKSRNCNQSIAEIIEQYFMGAYEFIDNIQLIARAYREYKKLNNIFDYDDLMETLRDKLRDNEKFRRTIQQLYQYIMVDEFQDTNVVQKDLIDLIAAGSRNVMIVGDDSQSIYAFRGANFENILRFPETYPDCKVVKLEFNYRSNHRILAFVNEIARNARLGYKKELVSHNENDVLPLIAKFYDQQEEAEFIVSRILELRERNIPLNQIAVLYRSSYHGTFIQTELLKRGIPYIVVGGIKFVERSHIKDIISYLRIVANPLDAIAWNRILKMVPGIGQVTASKIIDMVHHNNNVIDFTGFEGKKFGKDLERLGEVLTTIRRESVSLPVKIELLSDYYRPLIKNREPDWEVRMQDIDVLYKMAHKYQDLEVFLTDFALDPPSTKFQDSVKPLLDETEDQPVTLSTIHSAKGLEWYCVFIPHLLDGLFPSAKCLHNLEAYEEERRLFYVACSRAEEELYLTMPAYYSAWDNYFTKPSRFIAEVNKNKYQVYKPEKD